MLGKDSDCECVREREREREREKGCSVVAGGLIILSIHMRLSDKIVTITAKLKVH